MQTVFILCRCIHRVVSDRLCCFLQDQLTSIRYCVQETCTLSLRVEPALFVVVVRSLFPLLLDRQLRRFVRVFDVHQLVSCRQHSVAQPLCSLLHIDARAHTLIRSYAHTLARSRPAARSDFRCKSMEWNLGVELPPGAGM